MCSTCSLSIRVSGGQQHLAEVMDHNRRLGDLSEDVVIPAERWAAERAIVKRCSHSAWLGTGWKCNCLPSPAPPSLPRSEIMGGDSVIGSEMLLRSLRATWQLLGVLSRSLLLTIHSNPFAGELALVSGCSLGASTVRAVADMADVAVPSPPLPPLWRSASLGTQNMTRRCSMCGPHSA